MSQNRPGRFSSEPTIEGDGIFPQQHVSSHPLDRVSTYTLNESGVLTMNGMKLILAIIANFALGFASLSAQDEPNDAAECDPITQVECPGCFAAQSGFPEIPPPTLEVSYDYVNLDDGLCCRDKVGPSICYEEAPCFIRLKITVRDRVGDLWIFRDRFTHAGVQGPWSAWGQANVQNTYDIILDECNNSTYLEIEAMSSDPQAETEKFNFGMLCDACPLL